MDEPTANATSQLKTTIEPALKKWNSGKQPKFNADHGYERGWTAAQITKGPDWWSLDDVMADAARPHTEDGKLLWLDMATHWRLVPTAALPAIEAALGENVKRLQLRYYPADPQSS